MPQKSIPMSVRVSKEDAQFITSLNIPGASSPSDRLRSIIRQARENHEKKHDYESTSEKIRSLMEPGLARVRTAEQDLDMHSQLFTHVCDWIPDTLALLVDLTQNETEQPLEASELVKLEKQITDRVFRLVEQIFRLGITEHCPCYEPSIISHRIQPSLDLAKVITDSMDRKK